MKGTSSLVYYLNCHVGGLTWIRCRLVSAKLTINPEHSEHLY